MIYASSGMELLINPCWDFHLLSYFCELVLHMLTVFNSGFVKGGGAWKGQKLLGVKKTGLPTIISLFFMIFLLAPIMFHMGLD